MKASVYSRPASKPLTIPTRKRERVTVDIDTAIPTPLMVHAGTDCFVTPPDVAARVADYANLEEGLSVYDPEAGTGNFLQAVLDTGIKVELSAIELNHDLYTAIKTRFPDQDINVMHGDFLTFQGLQVDRFLMNPPFGKRLAYKHIAFARQCLAPNGSIIAVVPSNFEVDGMYPIEELPAGTFQNTQITTKIIEIEG